MDHDQSCGGVCCCFSDLDYSYGELCKLCGQNELVSQQEVELGVCADCAEVCVS
jgi:hypothetical protein